MRNFGIAEQSDSIKKAAADAVRSVFPVIGKTRTLELEDVTIDDRLDPTDFAEQAKAKSKDGTWGTSVYATLILKENQDSKVVDRAKVKVFTLPQITNRWSYIVKGNEYQVHNQLRLKPGVYTLRKQNGELKTQINLAKGKNFDLVFKEEKGQFFINKVGGGQANIPLYPVLIHLGVSPSLIAQTWGDRLASANRTTDQRAIAKAEAAFGLKDQSLKDYLSTRTEISPETTKIVLGKEFSRVDGPMLLAASKNLLDVHHGKKEPVDRDSLEFKELWSVEDFLHERLEKNKNSLAHRIRRGLNNRNRTKISQIVNPGAFSSTVESFFTQDDKASTPEQTNPLEMLTGGYKATIMGAGGISSNHAITPEMREVHPTHYGFMDPIHTPESDKIGANLHLPIGAIKDGKAVKMTVVDGKGKVHHLTPSEAYNKKVAFPGQTGQIVEALHRGQMVKIPKDQVDYYTPSATGLFSWSTNLVPFLPSNQGNRAMMASKMLEQAIALKHREAPLVQVGVGRAGTMEQAIGGEVAIRAKASGTVAKITEDFMTVKEDAGGERKYNLYNNFALNRKSFLHHHPRVKVGDRVKEGDLLADSNYTKDGTLALGTNLRVAYLPYKGLNFEDGVVITESAAEKLTSEHIHKKGLDTDETVVLNLAKFKASYPNALTPQNLEKLDKDGVIKKGQRVRMGETLVAALKLQTASADIRLISRQLANRPKNISVEWPYEDEGLVMDIQRRRGKVTVFVKTEERAKIGDKISGRMGNKGIITKIIPDAKAPKNKDGTPVEVLLNPHGVISRINIGQIYESAAGKAADKIGKPVSVKNFSGENYLASTKSILDRAGISDKEELYDPDSGELLGKVHVGKPYILKLFKQSTGNYSVRQGGAGNPYDANRQPLKSGGDDGSKNMDVLTMNSLLAHGARANLREIATTKADQNDEYWKALKSGQQLPPPKETFAYEKFIGYLKGAGIDVKKEGSKLTLAPLTDADVAKMSSLEIKNPQFFRAKDRTPIKGGFLDQAALGGFNGTKWGHLELTEPVINPVFEDAAKRLTGLGPKFGDIMAGKLFVDKDGVLNANGRGVTSGRAIEHFLKKVDVGAEIAALTKQAEKATGNKLDEINKKLAVLRPLQKLKLRPEEAYLRKKLPVIPSQYRPIYPLPDGNMTTSDVNVLYHNTGVINHMMKLPVMSLLPEEEKADIRKDLYEHVKGVSGLTDLNVKGRVREGFISDIKGGSGGQPKEGYFISKLLSKKQDFVGRGTIIPEPDLGIDEMAMPEDMAWKLFEPFLIRELKNHGKNPLQAKEEIKQRSKLARRALEIVMSQRKVLLNRAPSLHKFSVMAFKPKITSGRALKIPPLVVSGFNADFDGDTMTVHVPISDEANQEAEKMMPSRNLWKPGVKDRLMVSPDQEAQIGLFYLSKTPAGRNEINKIVGAKFAISEALDKKTTRALLIRLAKELPPDEFAAKLQKLKSTGEDAAYKRGFTLGIDDLVDFSKERDQLVKKTEQALGKAKTPEALGTVSTAAAKAVDNLLTGRLKDKGNPLFDMVESGARGNLSQLRQILVAPLFVNDARGRIVPTPVKKSYAEGLGVGDYWVSMYGARRGMMDRAIQTSLPGAFSKEIMATTLDNVISKDDCGAKEGVRLRISDADAQDRFLANAQFGFARNTLVDTSVVNALKKKGAETVEVRSPLTCLEPRGTCSFCYGVDEHGERPDVGENVGAKAGQTISEPLIQMVMNTFHTGGVAGTGADAKGFARIDQLLKLPNTVAGAAPLAPVSGKITKIEKGVGGGFDVTVGTQKVHVPQGRALKVKLGQEVARGDVLSDGAVRPQDIVKYKGSMRAAQEYIVDELHRNYKEQGQGIQRKVFETVVRSLGNYTKVLNNPKDTDHLPGDVISYSAVSHYNRNLEITLPAAEAEGYELGESYGPLKKGHRLSLDDCRLLSVLGHKEVRVKKEAIKHAPILKGVNSVPLLRKDWMAALGFRNLAKALTQGASEGWESDTAGYHPVPAFAQGATFGKGKDGRY